MKQREFLSFKINRDLVPLIAKYEKEVFSEPEARKMFEGLSFSAQMNWILNKLLEEHFRLEA